MEIINDLYIIPNYECNLNCPHCDVHNKKIKYNEEEFFNKLNTLSFKNGIVFGGEPLLYKDRFKKVIRTNKISSISTNLLLLDKEIVELLNEYNVSIATSWNPLRFNKEEEDIWFEKLMLIDSCTILITLTDDLITMDFEKFKNILRKIDNTNNVDGILFEQLLSDDTTEEFYNRVDEWLIKMYKNWDYTMKNFISDKVLNWKCDCSKTYTLEPNGLLRKGCPQATKLNIQQQCLVCPLSNICQPCVLQNHCTFPKNLYKIVKGE